MCDCGDLRAQFLSSVLNGSFTGGAEEGIKGVVGSTLSSTGDMTNISIEQAQNIISEAASQVKGLNEDINNLIERVDNVDQAFLTNAREVVSSTVEKIKNLEPGKLSAESGLSDIVKALQTFREQVAKKGNISKDAFNSLIDIIGKRSSKITGIDNPLESTVVFIGGASKGIIDISEGKIKQLTELMNVLDVVVSAGSKFIKSAEENAHTSSEKKMIERIKKYRDAISEIVDEIKHSVGIEGIIASKGKLGELIKKGASYREIVNEFSNDINPTNRRKILSLFEDIDSLPFHIDKLNKILKKLNLTEKQFNDMNKNDLSIFISKLINKADMKDKLKLQKYYKILSDANYLVGGSDVKYLFGASNELFTDKIIDAPTKFKIAEDKVSYGIRRSYEAKNDDHLEKIYKAAYKTVSSADYAKAPEEQLLNFLHALIDIKRLDISKIFDYSKINIYSKSYFDLNISHMFDNLIAAGNSLKPYVPEINDFVKEVENYKKFMFEVFGELSKKVEKKAVNTDVSMLFGGDCLQTEDIMTYYGGLSQMKFDRIIGMLMNSISLSNIKHGINLSIKDIEFYESHQNDMVGKIVGKEIDYMDKLVKGYIDKYNDVKNFPVDKALFKKVITNNLNGFISLKRASQGLDEMIRKYQIDVVKNSNNVNELVNLLKKITVDFNWIDEEQKEMIEFQKYFHLESVAKNDQDLDLDSILTTVDEHTGNIANTPDAGVFDDVTALPDFAMKKISDNNDYISKLEIGNDYANSKFENISPIPISLRYSEATEVSTLKLVYSGDMDVDQIINSEDINTYSGNPYYPAHTSDGSMEPADADGIAVTHTNYNHKGAQNGFIGPADTVVDVKFLKKEDRTNMYERSYILLKEAVQKSGALKNLMSIFQGIDKEYKSAGIKTSMSVETIYNHIVSYLVNTTMYPVMYIINDKYVAGFIALRQFGKDIVAPFEKYEGKYPFHYYSQLVHNSAAALENGERIDPLTYQTDNYLSRSEYRELDNYESGGLRGFKKDIDAIRTAGRFSTDVDIKAVTLTDENAKQYVITNVRVNPESNIKIYFKTKYHKSSNIAIILSTDSQLAASGNFNDAITALDRIYEHIKSNPSEWSSIISNRDFSKMFFHCDNICIMMLKSMFAKVMGTLSLYNLINLKMEGNLPIHHIKTIYGGDTDFNRYAPVPEIHNDYIELYVRLYIYGIFYKYLFFAHYHEGGDDGIKTQAGAFRRMTVLSNVGNKFDQLMSLFFLKNFDISKEIKHDDIIGRYINEVNKLASKSKPMDLLNEFVVEVNRRYGLAKSDNIKTYMKKEEKEVYDYETDFIDPKSVFSKDKPSRTRFELADILDKDEKDGKVPSDLYAFDRKYKLLDYKPYDKDNGYDFENINSIVYNFRRKLDNATRQLSGMYQIKVESVANNTDQNLIKRTGLHTRINMFKRMLENTRSPVMRYERIKHILKSLSDSSNSYVNIETLAYRELVIAPCKILLSNYIRLLGGTSLFGNTRNNVVLNKNLHIYDYASCLSDLVRIRDMGDGKPQLDFSNLSKVSADLLRQVTINHSLLKSTMSSDIVHQLDEFISWIIAFHKELWSNKSNLLHIDYDNLLLNPLVDVNSSPGIIKTTATSTSEYNQYFAYKGTEVSKDGYEQLYHPSVAKNNKSNLTISVLDFSMFNEHYNPSNVYHMLDYILFVIYKLFWEKHGTGYLKLFKGVVESSLSVSSSGINLKEITEQLGGMHVMRDDSVVSDKITSLFKYIVNQSNKDSYYTTDLSELPSGYTEDLRTYIPLFMMLCKHAYRTATIHKMYLEKNYYYKGADPLIEDLHIGQADISREDPYGAAGTPIGNAATIFKSENKELAGKFGIIGGAEESPFYNGNKPKNTDMAAKLNKFIKDQPGRFTENEKLPTDVRLVGKIDKSYVEDVGKIIGNSNIRKILNAYNEGVDIKFSIPENAPKSKLRMPSENDRNWARNILSQKPQCVYGVFVDTNEHKKVKHPEKCVDILSSLRAVANHYMMDTIEYELNMLNRLINIDSECRNVFPDLITMIKDISKYGNSITSVNAAAIAFTSNIRYNQSMNKYFEKGISNNNKVYHHILSFMLLIVYASKCKEPLEVIRSVCTLVPRIYNNACFVLSGKMSMNIELPDFSEYPMASKIAYYIKNRNDALSYKDSMGCIAGIFCKPEHDYEIVEGDSLCIQKNMVRAAISGMGNVSLVTMKGDLTEVACCDVSWDGSAEFTILETRLGKYLSSVLCKCKPDKVKTVLNKYREIKGNIQLPDDSDIERIVKIFNGKIKSKKSGFKICNDYTIEDKEFIARFIGFDNFDDIEPVFKRICEGSFVGYNGKSIFAKMSKCKYGSFKIPNRKKMEIVFGMDNSPVPKLSDEETKKLYQIIGGVKQKIVYTGNASRLQERLDSMNLTVEENNELHRYVVSTNDYNALSKSDNPAFIARKYNIADGFKPTEQYFNSIRGKLNKKEIIHDVKSDKEILMKKLSSLDGDLLKTIGRKVYCNAEEYQIRYISNLLDRLKWLTSKMNSGSNAVTRSDVYLCLDSLINSNCICSCHCKSLISTDNNFSILYEYGKDKIKGKFCICELKSGILCSPCGRVKNISWFATKYKNDSSIPFEFLGGKDVDDRVKFFMTSDLTRILSLDYIPEADVEVDNYNTLSTAQANPAYLTGVNITGSMPANLRGELYIPRKGDVNDYIKTDVIKTPVLKVEGEEFYNPIDILDRLEEYEKNIRYAIQTPVNAGATVAPKTSKIVSVIKDLIKGKTKSTNIDKANQLIKSIETNFNKLNSTSSDVVKFYKALYDITYRFSKMFPNHDTYSQSVEPYLRIDAANVSDSATNVSQYSTYKPFSDIGYTVNTHRSISESSHDIVNKFFDGINNLVKYFDALAENITELKTVSDYDSDYNDISTYVDIIYNDITGSIDERPPDTDTDRTDIGGYSLFEAFILLKNLVSKTNNGYDEYNEIENLIKNFNDNYKTNYNLMNKFYLNFVKLLEDITHTLIGNKTMYDVKSGGEMRATAYFITDEVRNHLLTPPANRTYDNFYKYIPHLYAKPGITPVNYAKANSPEDFVINDLASHLFKGNLGVSYLESAKFIGQHNDNNPRLITYELKALGGYEYTNIKPTRTVGSYINDTLKNSMGVLGIMGQVILQLITYRKGYRSVEEPDLLMNTETLFTNENYRKLVSTDITSYVPKMFDFISLKPKRLVNSVEEINDFCNIYNLLMMRHLTNKHGYVTSTGNLYERSGNGYAHENNYVYDISDILRSRGVSKYGHISSDLDHEYKVSDKHDDTNLYGDLGTDRFIYTYMSASDYVNKDVLNKPYYHIMEKYKSVMVKLYDYFVSSRVGSPVTPNYYFGDFTNFTYDIYKREPYDEDEFSPEGPMGIVYDGGVDNDNVMRSDNSDYPLENVNLTQHKEKNVLITTKLKDIIQSNINVFNKLVDLINNEFPDDYDSYIDDYDKQLFRDNQIYTDTAIRRVNSTDDISYTRETPNRTHIALGRINRTTSLVTPGSKDQIIKMIQLFDLHRFFIDYIELYQNIYKEQIDTDLFVRDLGKGRSFGVSRPNHNSSLFKDDNNLAANTTTVSKHYAKDTLYASFEDFDTGEYKNTTMAGLLLQVINYINPAMRSNVAAAATANTGPVVSPGNMLYVNDSKTVLYNVPSKITQDNVLGYGALTYTLLSDNINLIFENSKILSDQLEQLIEDIDVKFGIKGLNTIESYLYYFDSIYSELDKDIEDKLNKYIYSHEEVILSYIHQKYITFDNSTDVYNGLSATNKPLPHLIDMVSKYGAKNDDASIRTYHTVHEKLNGYISPDATSAAQTSTQTTNLNSKNMNKVIEFLTDEAILANATPSIVPGTNAPSSNSTVIASMNRIISLFNKINASHPTLRIEFREELKKVLLLSVFMYKFIRLNKAGNVNISNHVMRKLLSKMVNEIRQDTTAMNYNSLSENFNLSDAKDKANKAIRMSSQLFNVFKEIMGQIATPPKYGLIKDYPSDIGSIFEETELTELPLSISADSIPTVIVAKDDGGNSSNTIKSGHGIGLNAMGIKDLNSIFFGSKSSLYKINSMFLLDNSAYMVSMKDFPSLGRLSNTVSISKNDLQQFAQNYAVLTKYLYELQMKDNFSNAFPVLANLRNPKFGIKTQLTNPETLKDKIVQFVDNSNTTISDSDFISFVSTVLRRTDPTSKSMDTDANNFYKVLANFSKYIMVNNSFTEGNSLKDYILYQSDKSRYSKYLSMDSYLSPKNMRLSSVPRNTGASDEIDRLTAENILDTGLYPINIHAMMSEIPLSNMMNNTYTTNRMIEWLYSAEYIPRDDIPRESKRIQEFHLSRYLKDPLGSDMIPVRPSLGISSANSFRALFSVAKKGEFLQDGIPESNIGISSDISNIMPVGDNDSRRIIDVNYIKLKLNINRADIDNEGLIIGADLADATAIIIDKIKNNIDRARLMESSEKMNKHIKSTSDNDKTSTNFYKYLGYIEYGVAGGNVYNDGAATNNIFGVDVNYNPAGAGAVTYADVRDRFVTTNIRDNLPNASNNALNYHNTDTAIDNLSNLILKLFYYTTLRNNSTDMQFILNSIYRILIDKDDPSTTMANIMMKVAEKYTKYIGGMTDQQLTSLIVNDTSQDVDHNIDYHLKQLETNVLLPVIKEYSTGIETYEDLTNLTQGTNAYNIGVGAAVNNENRVPNADISTTNEVRDVDAFDDYRTFITHLSGDYAKVIEHNLYPVYSNITKAAAARNRRDVAANIDLGYQTERSKLLKTLLGDLPDNFNTVQYKYDKSRYYYHQIRGDKNIKLDNIHRGVDKNCQQPFYAIELYSELMTKTITDRLKKEFKEDLKDTKTGIISLYVE